MEHFDAIVIGTGALGAAALMHLAARGVRACGLDRFPPGHDRGSSHGQTRLIRMAYFEHPDYVPLLRRAYELWHELEELAGRPLLVESGLLMAGPPDGEVVAGALASAAIHGLPVERLTCGEAMARWPAFRLPEDWAAVHEARGGYLFVEECVRTCLRGRPAWCPHRTRLGGPRLANGRIGRTWRARRRGDRSRKLRSRQAGGHRRCLGG